MVQPVTDQKDAAMIVHQTQPFNAVPALTTLVDHYITPTELFFVRNHAPVPAIDLATYAVTVNGLQGEPLCLKLSEIQAIAPFVRQTVTLQCAGNRRQGFGQTFPGEVPWGDNALSTATWGGVLLADVLATLPIDPQARYIEFIGVDITERLGEATPFGGSIPLDYARKAGVLLAWEMNGGPLPPIHGGPLRVVVPSMIGARSVKWLGTIIFRPDPSPNYFQSKTYRLITEGATLDSAPMLGEVLVNSVICHPPEDDVLAAEPVIIRGYAVAGGLARVETVEFSPDGGESWLPATLQQEPQSGAWCLWECAVAPTPGTHEWVVRACDSDGNTQPEHPLWNAKGYLNNAWSRRLVTIR